MGGISIPSLVLILVIILLLFGTKKLKTLGSDLGSAIKGFQKSIKDTDNSQDADFDKKSVDDKTAVNDKNNQ